VAMIFLHIQYSTSRFECGGPRGLLKFSRHVPKLFFISSWQTRTGALLPALQPAMCISECNLLLLGSV
jgi:hypothetical protein